MPRVIARGGAKVGLMRASWPFACLIADKDSVSLRVFLLGSYQFGHSDILVLDLEDSFLGMKQGLRIRHGNPTYPERLVFWPVCGAANLRDRIEALRQHTGSGGSALPIPEPGGFPFRILPLAVVVLIWNLIFLYDMNFTLPFGQSGGSPSFGLPVQIAQGGAALLALGIVFLPPVRRLFVKESAKAADTDPTLYFVAAVTTLLLVVSTVFS